MRRAVLVLSLAACGLSVDGTGAGNGASPSPSPPLPNSDGGDAVEGGGGVDGGDGGGTSQDASLASDGGEAGADAGVDGAVGPGWAYRRKLTIDNSAHDALTDFPLLVALNASRISYPHCLPSGADLRFTDLGGTPLDYEFEFWQSGANSYVWVRVPQIAARAKTDIWMIYGNPSAVDAQAPPKVWDVGFIGVWHLASANDSTGKHASTNAGGTPTKGFIGPALAFNGTNQYFDTNATEQLDSWTIEAWANATHPASSGPSWSGPLIRDNYNLQWDCNDPSFCRAGSVLLHPPDNWVEAPFGALIAQTWYYLAATFDTHTLVSYLYGQSSGSKSIGTNTAAPATGSAKIAANRDATSFFAGTVDEVRISNVVRTSDWIGAQQLSMKDTGYVSFGAEQNY